MEEIISVRLIGPSLWRHGIGALLGQFSDVSVREEDASASEATVLLFLLPDCGEIGRFAETPGLAETRLRRAVVLTRGTEAEICETGAQGIDVFLSIHDTPDVLRQGIHAAAAFRPFCSPHLTSDLVGALNRHAVAARHRAVRATQRRRYGSNSGLLSEREREIALLAASGHSNEEIAARCFIQVSTVKTHLGEAFRKLGIRRRSQLSSSLQARALRL